MLPDAKDFDQLTRQFRWNIPARYNIGVDVCDKWAMADPARLAILPLVSLATSLAGIVQSPRPGLAVAGWVVGLALALPLGYAVGSRRVARWRPEDGRLEVAGGWFALVFGISIFATRYAQGVLSGMMPGLQADPLWLALSGGIGGVVCGLGLGWLANLLRRPRPGAAA